MKKGGKHPGGRPLIVDDAILQKLEHVFSIGGTDLEAIGYAGISSATFYNYQNAHPEFLEKKKILKERPILKARSIVMKSLENHDEATARWYLERKRKDEFSVRSETTGKDGEPLPMPAQGTTFNINFVKPLELPSSDREKFPLTIDDVKKR